MLDPGKRARGLFVKLPTTDVIDLVVGAGFDFAVVDLEHSQLGEHEAFRLIRYGHVLGLPTLVRVSAAERGLVNRLLEAGAAGIHLSTVRRAEQVRELRAAMRYAPHGNRSISLTHPRARFGAIAVGDYLASEERDAPLLVAQLETAETDDSLDEIVAAGPDVLFIGAMDLAVDVGLDEARLARRIDEIAAVAARAGVPLGGFGLDDERVVYDAVSTDVGLLRRAMLDAA